MLFTALATAAGIGANIWAQNKASKSRKSGVRENDKLQKYIASLYNRRFDETQQDLNPYIEEGREANALVASALGLNGRDEQENFFQNFQYDPGFQEALGLGIDSIDKSAAARGTLNSGRTLKDVSKYVTDSTLHGAFGDRLNRLSQVGASGQNAANNLINARNLATQGEAGTVQSRANAVMGLSQQQANSAINTGNMINHGLNQFSKANAFNQYMNKLPATNPASWQTTVNPAGGSSLGNAFTRFF
jgi:hypothetical protein